MRPMIFAVLEHEQSKQISGHDKLVCICCLQAGVGEIILNTAKKGLDRKLNWMRAKGAGSDHFVETGGKICGYFAGNVKTNRNIEV